jgi:hypothetical protein
MECIQIIVKIELDEIVNLLKEKGHELENLISLHGNYATFAGDSTFSWKWLAANFSWMDNWYDADCIEFREDNVTIVAALWQHDGDEALTQWYACNGCSDDLIFDNKYVYKILAEVQSETEITKFDFDRTAWLNARAQKAKPVSNKIVVPSREQMTRDWLVSLTVADWQNISLTDINYKILDEWENPIFKKLQLEYKGSVNEFNKLALKAIQDNQGWVGVEAIKAKPVPKAKPVLVNKK